MIKKVIDKLYRIVTKEAHHDNSIYLIYSMGKVGSSTIYDSLKQKKPSADIFHVHFLSNNWLTNILPTLHENFHGNIATGNNILNHIRENPKKKIKIITLVREPIDRAISDLFQNWRHMYNDINTVENEKLKAHIESLDHKYTLEWFDTEFYDYLKFNVYNYPFDKTKGFEIYNYGKFDILLLKLEMLNKVSSEAFKEFIGLDLKLSLKNTSIQKAGSNKYKFLKDNVKINVDLLSDIYNSKYVKHFYSIDEINAFMNKWA